MISFLHDFLVMKLDILSENLFKKEKNFVKEKEIILRKRKMW